MKESLAIWAGMPLAQGSLQLKKGGKSMIASLTRSVLAGAIVGLLAVPAWAMSSSKIIKVQEALKEKGDNPGPADGIMGKKTRSALKAFQKANGLKATGTLDDQTAAKLGVSKP